LLVYGPSSKADAQVISMSAEIREEIVMLAFEAMGIDEHENRNAA
jgi:hypothetical protein